MKNLCRALATALVLSVALFSNRNPASASDLECPFCAAPVVHARASVLKSGKKSVEYKCLYCALGDANSQYPRGDLSVTSPGEGKSPVALRRVGNTWSATPKTAAFVSPKHLKHQRCGDQARAFTTRAAALAFARKSGGNLLTLAQLSDLVK